MSRTHLNSDELEWLAQNIVAGNAWADAKTNFLAKNPFASEVNDAYQTSCENRAREIIAERTPSKEAQFDDTLKALQTPNATAIYPVSGYAKGGQKVTVVGVQLGNVTGITIGGVACTGVKATPTEVTGFTPAHAVAANLDVVVSDGTLTDTLVAAFAYVANPTPAIGGWQPKKIQAKGKTRLVIAGTGFNYVNSVTVGGHACSIKEVTSNRIVAETPAHAVANDLDLVVSDGTLSDTEAAALDVVASTTPFPV